MKDHCDHPINQSESRDSNVPAVVLLAAVTLAALALRLYRLDHESLWYDELTQTATYHLPISYLIPEVAGHGQPPLDYLIGAGLDRAGLAASDWWVRLPAALFGTFSVLLTGILMRRVAGTAAGVGAALLLAVCPLHVVMSQEARPYTIFVCLAMTTLLAFAHARRRHTAIAWALFAVSAIAMLLSRWVAPNLIMLGLGAYAVGSWIRSRWRSDALERRTETQRLWAAFTAATLAYAVYGPSFGMIVDRARRAVGASAIPWTTRFADQLFESYQAVFAGYSTQTLFDALPAPLWLLALAAAAIATGVLVTLPIVARRNPEAGLLLLLLVPFPLVYAAVYAKLTHVQPKPQYLLLMSVPVAAMIAIAASGIARRIAHRARAWHSITTALLLAIFAVPMARASWHSLTVRDKRDWRGLMTHLSETASPGDAFAVIGADTVPAVYHPAAAGNHRYGLGWARFLPIEIDTEPRELQDDVWRGESNTLWIIGIKDRLYEGRNQLTAPEMIQDGWSLYESFGLFAVAVRDRRPAISRLTHALERIADPLPTGRGAVAPHMFRGRMLLSRGQINRAHRAFAAAVRQCRTPDEIRALIEDYIPRNHDSRLTDATP